MTRDLGVWTAEDSALVLIDYQKDMFEVIRSERNADLVELHVRLLAKTAKAFGMPIVLSTVGVEYGFNGPTLPSILSELDGIEPIDKSSMNAFTLRWTNGFSWTFGLGSTETSRPHRSASRRARPALDGNTSRPPPTSSHRHPGTTRRSTTAS